MKKGDNKIIINCTTDFKSEMQELADEQDMNLSSYCRFILKHNRIKLIEETE